MGNPCLRCGACCAHYRVSFYWTEADAFLGGVPAAMTSPLNHHRVVMNGTHCAPVRCVALDGVVGEQVACSIYAQRPSPCRELEPWCELGGTSPHCTVARAAHGLPPLEPPDHRPDWGGTPLSA